MTVWEIVVLAIALAVDAFSVGAAVGLRHRKPRQIFRLSFHFGLFQALFPLLGALAGEALVSRVANWDHWIVFAVLAVLGARMIYGALYDDEKEHGELDLTRGVSLIGLSTAVSIDAAAAGITLAITQAPIALSVTIIGVVAAAATAIAMIGAHRFSDKLGKRAEVVAGAVLIVLGAKTLIDHLGAGSEG
jgi:putative Mn2+ efflux pump MntP